MSVRLPLAKFYTRSILSRHRQSGACHEVIIAGEMEVTGDVKNPIQPSKMLATSFDMEASVNTAVFAAAEMNNINLFKVIAVT